MRTISLRIHARLSKIIIEIANEHELIHAQRTHARTSTATDDESWEHISNDRSLTISVSVCVHSIWINLKKMWRAVPAWRGNELKTRARQRRNEMLGMQLWRIRVGGEFSTNEFGFLLKSFVHVLLASEVRRGNSLCITAGNWNGIYADRIARNCINVENIKVT